MLSQFIHRHPHLALLLITLGGLLLRLVRLGSPVWGDETASWAFARRTPFSAMWAYALNDPTPPLYYALLHSLMPLLGSDPVGLRLPSVLAGLLAVPLAYGTLRQARFPARDGLAAALLVAVSSLLIYYSQEARAYALFALLALLSITLLLRLLRSQRPLELALYLLILVALAYTHRYAYFLIAAEVGCLFLFRRWRALLLTSALTLLLLALLAVQMRSGSFNYGPSGDPSNGQAITALLHSLTLGTVSMQSIVKLPNSSLLAFPEPHLNRALPALGLLLLVTIGVQGALHARAHSATQRQAIQVLAICIALPGALALLAGSPLSPKPQWLLRGLIFVWPLFMMLAVAALSGTRWQRTVMAGLLALNLLSLYPYYTRYTRFAHAEQFVQLSEQAGPEDLIVADPWYMSDFIDYYTQAEVPIVGFGAEEGWVDVATMARRNDPVLLRLEAPQNPRAMCTSTIARAI